MPRRIGFVTLVLVALAFALYGLLPELVSRGIYLSALPEPGVAESEQKRLREAWGPESYGQSAEDLKILDFFQGRGDGVFVDVGANDYKQLSNTYLLETRYGWSGLAIDALEEFRAGYEEHRPLTRFRTFYVSDTSDQMAEFYVVEGRHEQSTGVKENADSKPSGYSTIEVPRITLDHLLELEGITAIDFLTMDIELAEPEALRGFDIERFRPELVCIEKHPPVADQLSRYFGEHGYVELELWSRLDSRNSFYVRADLVEKTVQRIEADLETYHEAHSKP